MPTNQQVEFPPPLNWQELQRMTCDLFRKLWRNPHSQGFGRLGATQHGVDIYGVVEKAKKKRVEGVQCKVTSRLTADQVEVEYKKFHSFRPELGRFILVTTAKRNAEAQQKAVELTLGGKYPCDLMFWEDFCAKLGQYSKLIRKQSVTSFMSTWSVRQNVRNRDTTRRNCRQVQPHQREATRRRLAIHHRQSQNQIEATLPENLDWTEH